MRLAFFEDRAADQFGPIALTRPVFELVCGQCSLRERVLRRLVIDEWGAFIRAALVETYREAQPHAHVNDHSWLAAGPVLLINGRWLPSWSALNNLRQDEALLLDGVVVAISLEPEEAVLLAVHDWHEVLSRLARHRRSRVAEGVLASRPWDLVNHNAQQLREDFHLLEPQAACTEFGPHVAILGPTENVHVDASATIDPFVVLDARQGPVSIDRDAVIRSFTGLEGPCHVGQGSQLFRAHVREGTTIGPVCRVGGEIEESILHAYVNKYHTGFLGHSYVCPWVNLGALSTNSDLKNDYSTVKVPLDGELMETGMTKVGCFIGDHTKTALGSLFNTGSSIGVLSMVLPGGELLPKHIPSFTRIWHGELAEGWEIERALTTARAAMTRRNCQFTPAMERLLRRLYDQTRDERAAAIDRAKAKRDSVHNQPDAVTGATQFAH